jgi:hypothetical protein
MDDLIFIQRVLFCKRFLLSIDEFRAEWYKYDNYDETGFESSEIEFGGKSKF